MIFDDDWVLKANIFYFDSIINALTLCLEQGRCGQQDNNLQVLKDFECIEESSNGDEESKKDDKHFDVNNDEIWVHLKLNFVTILLSSRKQYTISSRFSILLSRMVVIPMVRPTLENNFFYLE